MGAVASDGSRGLASEGQWGRRTTLTPRPLPEGEGARTAGRQAQRSFRAYQLSQPKWPVLPMGAHSFSKPIFR